MFFHLVLGREREREREGGKTKKSFNITVKTFFSFLEEWNTPCLFLQNGTPKAGGPCIKAEEAMLKAFTKVQKYTHGFKLHVSITFNDSLLACLAAHCIDKLTK